MKALILNSGRALALLTVVTLTASPALAQDGGRGGGQGTQDVVGGVSTPGGRQTAPPRPAPRDANGRAILGGENPKDKGLWLPVFGILDPILAVPKVPFQPWARAVYADRQKNELEPHTRRKPAGGGGQSRG